jgi:hypothetical protein
VESERPCNNINFEGRQIFSSCPKDCNSQIELEGALCGGVDGIELEMMVRWFKQFETAAVSCVILSSSSTSASKSVSFVLKNSSTLQT